ncbi:M20/M25/M40 family metallo-hydrolase [Hyphococcus sp.]|uniref:M20/M25/M40 family metallo-hydrolase n=1 Tax=Hyphococcus sp. TaxID=2038636 RepID=UPI003CCBC641
MKILVTAACAVFTSIGCAYAQAPEPASAPALTQEQQRTVDRLIDEGLEDDLAWELLESLTTEIGPRLGGSPAEARARDWGVAKLKALGFKNVRIETFEMPYWERDEESARIVSPFPQELKISALGNSVATPEGGVTAEVVRFRTLLDLQDAPLEGFEGKLIFVDEVMARTQDGSGYGWAVAKRSGAANEAARRGAAVALIRSAGTSHGRTPHTGNMRYEEDITPVPIAALSNPDADLLSLAMRRAGGPVNVNVNISVNTKTVVESGNVIGEIPGKTDEIILIGGHLDSWDLGTGAVDDGAGVAITTAAAKLIDELRGKPARTIRVIMWGAEEVGLLGAQAYAQAHADELHRHVLASESDFGAGRVWQFRTGFAEEDLPKAQVYQKALRRLGIGPGHNMAGGGPDVTPLRRAGVPVFRLYQDGSDYFDLHHTMEDTLDKVDPAALRQNVAAWAAAVYIASELEGDYRASDAE